MLFSGDARVTATAEHPSTHLSQQVCSTLLLCHTPSQRPSCNTLSLTSTTLLLLRPHFCPPQGVAKMRKQCSSCAVPLQLFCGSVGPVHGWGRGGGGGGRREGAGVRDRIFTPRDRQTGQPLVLHISRSEVTLPSGLFFPVPNNPYGFCGR